MRITNLLCLVLGSVGSALATGTACSGVVDTKGTAPAQTGGGTGATGGSGSAGGGSIVKGSGGGGTSSGGGSGGGASGGGSSAGGTGGVGPIVVPAAEGATLRLLTRAEYVTTLTALLGAIKADLPLEDDTSVAGFVAVGASQISVSELAAEGYETASRAATAEVFGDATRWQKLVGCQPKADLSDACISTYVSTFGRQAFRRPLTTDESGAWLAVARAAAKVDGSSAALGLSTMTSGMLQSPSFLYRVEATKPDATTGRLKFDGGSMATRLSYLLTGSTPTVDLLTAAAAGTLDTADGIRTTATGLLSGSTASSRLAEFFTELSDVGRIGEVVKDPTQFAVLDDTLRSSMLEETRQFISKIVLAPGADVRSLFDSNRTYVNASLAAFYGLPAPVAGTYAETALPATTGRAGILGQGSFLAVHSTPTSSAPARRGNFIVSHFLCQEPPPPPPGVELTISIDPGQQITTRQRFEQHRTDPSCVACHALMDPYGFALEHFDPIGRYRATENGLPIDATGTLNGKPFDGAAQLAALMRNDPSVPTCMLRNFYRHANGTPNDAADNALIGQLAMSLSNRNYVWRDLVSDFVAGDAFRSRLPTPPATRSP